MDSKTEVSTAEMFLERVAAESGAPLRALGIDVLQVNLGFRCNMSCKHCHLEAGPAREAMMVGETADRVLSVLANNDIQALDLTGGAPELNPHFRRLVDEARKLGKKVIIRSNLTIFYENGMGGLPEFFAEKGVEVIASLPCYVEGNVDRVRGAGTFMKSIGALKRLNALGFGIEKSGKTLNLVYNPLGAFLPPRQEPLEEEYRRELKRNFGIVFNKLFTFTNMPIGRFRESLKLSDNYGSYAQALIDAFNPAALDGLMCRHLISVAWDGTLHDCDFNLALGIELGEGSPQHINDFDYTALSTRQIAVAGHCFGCTAEQGST